MFKKYYHPYGQIKFGWGRGQKFHSSAQNYDCKLERMSNASQTTHPVGRVLLEE